jgi:hypothetical protein
MDNRQIKNLTEAYNTVYEQQIGVPLKNASDRAAKEQLQKMIPKGEKVHTPKSSLQNAAYEPEGDEISEEDVFDEVMELLLDEGFSTQDALEIMATMTESILEMSDFEAGGGNAKMRKTGMSRSEVEALGKKNLQKSSSSSKESSKRVVGSTPSDVARDRQDATERRREREREALASGAGSPVRLRARELAQAQEKRYKEWEKNRSWKPPSGWEGLAG